MKGYNAWAPSWEFGDAQQVVDAGLDTVRVQFTLDGYSYENQLAAFRDVMLPDCHAAGLNIVLNIWHKSMPFADIEAAWVDIFTEFDHRAVIVAYDLVNEPKGLNNGLTEYHDYIPGMVCRLRALTDKTFIIESGYGPVSDGFAELTPVNDDNVIYSFHAYWPYPFAFQGLDGKPVNQEWPGEYYGAHRDIEFLRKVYKDAREFQIKYGVPIYIGEFGVSKHSDADDAERWLADHVTLFNGYGWGWAVHSFNSDDWPKRLDYIASIKDAI